MMSLRASRWGESAHNDRAIKHTIRLAPLAIHIAFRSHCYVTLLFDSFPFFFSIHFLAFIPVYDYEKRVMNDKYVRVYIDIVYSVVITVRKTAAKHIFHRDVI